jgi:quinoprotein glucose dehydrogenase
MMATAATVPLVRPRISRRAETRTMRSLLAVSGSIIALSGVVLAIGGASSTTDGGTFFIVAGFGLIMSGALLARRHVAGAWTYLAVFAATLTWSLRDSGLGGSPVAYRVTGPIIMLIMLALLMPALRRWSRRRTLVVLAGLIMTTVTVGDYSSGHDGQLANLAATALFHDAQAKGAIK